MNFSLKICFVSVYTTVVHAESWSPFVSTFWHFLDNLPMVSVSTGQWKCETVCGRLFEVVKEKDQKAVTEKRSFKRLVAAEKLLFVYLWLYCY